MSQYENLEHYREDVYTCNRTRCGFCREACPAFIAEPYESNSSRGKMLISRALLEQKIEPSWEMYGTVMKCTLNGYCESMCSLNNVDMLQAMRVEMFRKGFTPRLTRWMLRGLFPKPSRIRAAGKIASLAVKLNVGRFIRLLPKPIERHLRYLAMLPNDASPFQAFNEKSPSRAKFKVGYFVGCANRMFYGARGEALTRVLEANDCSVTVLDQETCCGLPHWYNGDLDMQLELGLKSLQQFDDLGLDYIVSDAASCVSTLHRLPGALRRNGAIKESERVQATLDKFVDVCSFLTDIVPVRPGKNLGPLDITLHSSCYLRYGLRQPDILKRLLGKIPGITVCEAEHGDTCCGGPEFLAHQSDLADKLHDLKAAGIQKTAAPILISTSGGCIMTMEYALRQRNVNVVVMHPIELLAAGYGYRTPAARAANLR